MSGDQVLEAARSGDERAFAALIDPHRRELYAHCYRMLGSVTDAEDALQDALLGAWRGLARFQGRASLRSWLYTITTNACLRAIERRPKRVLPIDYGPPGDPRERLAEPVVESAWIEPFPDALLAGPAMPDARYEQREAIELAFIAALQHLPARQRAVLILRDVLGFSARETADAIDATPAAVDSALQRAHQTVDARLPERSQQQALRSLRDAELTRLVEEFVAAWERSDVSAVVSMLAHDAVLAMPPGREWFTGRETIADFSPPTRSPPTRRTIGWCRRGPTDSRRSASTAGATTRARSPATGSACSRCAGRRSPTSRSSGAPTRSPASACPSV